MDIKRLDFNLLVTLDALLAERSVSRAAQRLNLSQPALSAQLARLREMLGDPLFVPSHRGMTPTPLALGLQAPLAAALAQLRDVVTSARAFDPARDEFTVHVAASDYVQSALLLDFTLALRREAPGVRIALRPADAARLAAQMEQGEVDVAMLTPDGIAGALRSRRLFEERYVFIARRGHPALRRPLSAARFCELEHVMVSPRGGSFATPVDDVLDAQGLRRRVVVSASTFRSVPDLVERSDLVALVPARMVEGRAGRLRVLAPPFPVPGFAIHMAWHNRNHGDAAQRWVRERLVAFAQYSAQAARPATGVAVRAGR
ncbi:LysR family transcriptional regulator [Massilia rhizosphaerae]|uniref:LysR family transcriptional regulator n=1 Tax=Massilia rhizosphaerae TaxID=2784389 RepID=UPI0018DE456E|nr:LysR family transcriptional regulator [Massilia rhizosphaerae]